MLLPPVVLTEALIISPPGDYESGFTVDQVAELEAAVTDRETQITHLEPERAALKSALADC